MRSKMFSRTLKLTIVSGGFRNIFGGTVWDKRGVRVN